ncbi:MAG: apolipoprotein N-acyltransferase [Cyanobacteria bacterium P01_H01_bin.121]
MCGISGIAMAIAAPPLGWHWLAWIAMAPPWLCLSLEIQARTGASKQHTQPKIKRQFPWFALLWGSCYYGWLFAWLTGLHPLTWLGLNWWSSVAIAFTAWVLSTLWATAVVLGWALLQGWLATWLLLLRTWWGRVLTGVTFWLMLDWLQSQSPLYWGTLALTQSPGNLPILHLGQLGGPQLIMALLLAVNGCLAEGAIAATQRSGLLNELSNHLPVPSRLPVIVAIALLLTGLGVGSWQMQQRRPDQPAQALTIGIIQGNVPTDEKLTAAGLRLSMQRYTEGYQALVEADVDQKVDLVVTPEGALPVFWEGLMSQQSNLAIAVRQAGVPLWLGTFLREQSTVRNQSSNNYTQSLLLLGASELASPDSGRYDKVKLVPLGEYIPLENWLGSLVRRLSPIQSSLVPGDRNQVVTTPWGPVAVGICYEPPFTVLWRRQVFAGGQWLLIASNLDPYSETLMQQHTALAVLRAIESDRWAVQVANTGYSTVINPAGKLIWQSQPKTYSVHADAIFRRTTLTPYIRWGNWVLPACLLLWLICVLRWQFVL